MFLAGKRRLVNAHLARNHGKKSFGRISGKKDILSTCIGFPLGNAGQGHVFLGAKAGKKSDVGDGLSYIHDLFPF